MSAAERLKALDEATSRRWDVNPRPGQTFYELLNEAEAARQFLAAVLPQIVAVVEAAEHYGLAQEVHVWGKEGEYAFPDLASALAALEETLS